MLVAELGLEHRSLDPDTEWQPVVPGVRVESAWGSLGSRAGWGHNYAVVAVSPAWWPYRLSRLWGDIESLGALPFCTLSVLLGLPGWASPALGIAPSFWAHLLFYPHKLGLSVVRTCASLSPQLGYQHPSLPMRKLRPRV